MNDVPHDKKGDLIGRVAKTFLFFSNWLFVLLFSKRLISPPGGNTDFLLKNVATLFVALVMTGLMIHFFSRKVMIVFIPIMAILALAIAVTWIDWAHNKRLHRIANSENRDLTWPALLKGISTPLDILAHWLEGANMTTKPKIDIIRSRLSSTDVECLDDKYRGIYWVYSFRCSKGHEFRATWDDVQTILERQLSPCLLCTIENRTRLLFSVEKAILSQARKWLTKLGFWLGTYQQHKTLSDYCPQCEFEMNNPFWPQHSGKWVH